VINWHPISYRFEVIADCCSNFGHCALENLGSTDTVHLRLIGKRLVDFLAVLIELFARCYGWGVTSENRLKIGVLQRGEHSVLAKFSRRRGRRPPIHAVYTDIGEWMPHNFVADGFHTKKLCSRLSSSEVPFYWKNGRFAFFWALLGSLGATYWYHSKAHMRLPISD